MRVLFAGTPGVRKEDVLERLKECIVDERVCGPDQRVFKRVLEDWLYEKDPQTFLDRPFTARQARWKEAFARFRREEKKSGADHTFLGVHLSYRHNQIPSCAVDLLEILRWKPHCIVTLIDDAYAVRHRIHHGGYTSFTLAELVLWRAEELLIADLLARLTNRRKPIPNFLFAVKHPGAMLTRLLASVCGDTKLHRPIARVYLSYHMTTTRDEANLRAVIDAFRRKAQFPVRDKAEAMENLAVFDPAAIDELPLIKLARRGAGNLQYRVRDPRHRWPLLQPGKLLVSDDDIPDRLTIPRDEIRAAGRAIDKQVEARDIRLVDQSHVVCAYRPSLLGFKPGTGQRAELDHARHTGRKIIQYIKKGEEEPPPSSFWPSGGPYCFHEKTETHFWRTLATLHNDLPDLDAFLL